MTLFQDKDVKGAGQALRRGTVIASIRFSTPYAQSVPLLSSISFDAHDTWRKNAVISLQSQHRFDF